jgi:hypothetical protein
MRLCSFAILPLALLTLASSSCAYALGGSNCDVAAPPEQAGENSVHGIFLKVYPRRTELPPNYTGCQSAWLKYPEGWQLTFRLTLHEGKVVELWSPEFICNYRNDKLVPGRSAECDQAAPVPLLSLPPGCITKEGVSTLARCSVNETAR